MPIMEEKYEVEKRDPKDLPTKSRIVSVIIVIAVLLAITVVSAYVSSFGA